MSSSSRHSLMHRVLPRGFLSPIRRDARLCLVEYFARWDGAGIMNAQELDWPRLRELLRPPVAVALGSPAEAVAVVEGLGAQGTVCWQLDLHQAARLRAALSERRLEALVRTEADLWNLSAEYQTVFYAVPRGGERELKLDTVEQAFHILRPRGTLAVWSPYGHDRLFPQALKKVFGRFHAPGVRGGPLFWAQRQGDRPRRRHEVAFQVRLEPGRSLRFVSRPGVFSYGRLDNGARALLETMDIRPGDRVLDIGCGCGTNGIIAGLRAGPSGHVTFVDSNLRALALLAKNAQANGLVEFEAIASDRVEGPLEGSFDVALANPPYYAQGSIAQLFIERARAMLKRGGRFYLVTKQPAQAAPVMEAAFGKFVSVTRRGYVVLCA